MINYLEQSFENSFYNFTEEIFNEIKDNVKEKFEEVTKDLTYGEKVNIYYDFIQEHEILLNDWFTRKQLFN